MYIALPAFPAICFCCKLYIGICCQIIFLHFVSYIAINTHKLKTKCMTDIPPNVLNHIVCIYFKLQAVGNAVMFGFRIWSPTPPPLNSPQPIASTLRLEVCIHLFSYSHILLYSSIKYCNLVDMYNIGSISGEGIHKR